MHNFCFGPAFPLNFLNLATLSEGFSFWQRGSYHLKSKQSRDKKQMELDRLLRELHFYNDHFEVRSTLRSAEVIKGRKSEMPYFWNMPLSPHFIERRLPKEEVNSSFLLFSSSLVQQLKIRYLPSPGTNQVQWPNSGGSW